MAEIEIKTTTGETVTISETELQRAGIVYLRNYSPDMVCIIAEEINDNGQLKTVPAAVFMLLKNPKDVVYYTQVIELEKDKE